VQKLFLDCYDTAQKMLNIAALAFKIGVDTTDILMF
jgi:hypothetical protein